MTRNELLSAIAVTTADYRSGELPTPTADHVERWVRQFDAKVQLPILAGLSHALAEVYASRQAVERFLGQVVVHDGLTQGNARGFWRGAGILNIQQGGASQAEMLQLLDDVLTAEVGFGVDECEGTSGTFVYVDDGIFSGTRVRYDLEAWLEDAPEESTVHIVIMALHAGGQWYAEKEIKKKATKLGKKITLHWGRCIMLEDRKAYVDQADVLRVTHLPDDPEVAAYATSLERSGYPLVYRAGTDLGKLKLYPSHDIRVVLEQEFLKAGVKIRAMCPHLKVTHRPLGYSKLDALGFGTMFLTHRNCPNNTPLVFWAGDPWYPLFPRKTNTQTNWGG